MSTPWHPGSWRDYPAAQQPEWADPVRLDQVTRELAGRPPLVPPDEVSALGDALCRAAAGEAFVVQAGECSERFGIRGRRDGAVNAALIARTAVRVSAASERPVLTVGRLAGQFAKPRSFPTETIGRRVLPAFRGLLVNCFETTEAARRADPDRLLAGYAAARGISEAVRQEVGSATNAWAGTRRRAGKWTHQGLWFSHEALLLPFEEAMVRSTPDGRRYLSSTHWPWIGVRSGGVQSAHVEFLSGVVNPVSYKVGPDSSADAVVGVCDKLDPERTLGRLTLVCRLGARAVGELLPGIVTAVRRAGHPVLWLCDPMHANTVRLPSGRKTRYLADVLDEVATYFAVHQELGSWPGGVQLETSGSDVTECLGGAGGPTEPNELDRRYDTTCDPRLNPRQVETVADLVGDLLGRTAVRS
jgi:3-deoxy-7-phosphoheptulonate synthase